MRAHTYGGGGDACVLTANLTEPDGSTPSAESSRREPGSPSCAGSMWGEVVGKKREAWLRGLSQVLLGARPEKRGEGACGE